jgi:hypothetical protein
MDILSAHCMLVNDVENLEPSWRGFHLKMNLWVVSQKGKESHKIGGHDPVEY